MVVAAAAVLQVTVQSVEPAEVLLALVAPHLAQPWAVVVVAPVQVAPQAQAVHHQAQQDHRSMVVLVVMATLLVVRVGMVLPVVVKVVVQPV